VCLAVLSLMGKAGTRLASYGLELSSLEVISLAARQLGIQLRCLPCPKGVLGELLPKARSIHSLWEQDYIHMYQFNSGVGPALPIPQPLLSLGIAGFGLTSVEGWIRKANHIRLQEAEEANMYFRQD